MPSEILLEARPKNVWSELPKFGLQLIVAASILGIAVDVITANVAVKYFTVHHPHVVESDSPWVMALIWGVGASWWVGLLAAPLLWWANVSRPDPLPRRRVMQASVRAMALIWAIMMAILVTVYLVAGLIPLEQRRPSFESDRRLMSVAMAHASEYVLAGIMVGALVIRIRRIRKPDPLP